MRQAASWTGTPSVKGLVRVDAHGIVDRQHGGLTVSVLSRQKHTSEREYHPVLTVWRIQIYLEHGDEFLVPPSWIRLSACVYERERERFNLTNPWFTGCRDCTPLLIFYSLV